MVVDAAVAHYHMAQLAAGRLMTADRLTLFDLGQLVAQVDGAFRQVFQGLADDLDALIALQHAHQHTGEHVAAVHGVNFEVKVVIGGVGSILAHVNGHAGGSGMGTHGAHADGVLPGQHAHALGAHSDGLVGKGDLGDAVQGAFQLLAGGEQLPPQVIVNIPPRAADSDHGVVDTVAGHLLQQVHHQLTLIPDVHEHAVMADDVAGDAQPQEVGVQPLQLGGDDADILASLGHLHAVDVLHAHGVGKGVGVGADAADPLHQDQGLDGVALRGQLLNAPVVVAHENLGILDHFPLGIELGVDRLFQGRMVGADGNNIAHFPSPPRFFSTSSLRGMTMIWPLPWVSSISSGRNSRLEVSRPSNSTANSSLSSLSGQVAAVS